jgi:hypothetical protein
MVDCSCSVGSKDDLTRTGMAYSRVLVALMKSRIGVQQREHGVTGNVSSMGLQLPQM